MLLSKPLQPFTIKCLVLALGILFMQACTPKNTMPDLPKAPIAERVADWQLAHMDDFGYVRTFRDHTEDERGWVQAAFFVGLDRWAHSQGSQRHRDALYQLLQARQWRLSDKDWHADEQVIGFVYAQQALRSSNPKYLAATRKAFEQILANPADNSLEYIPDNSGLAEATCQRRWCWCDALFMAPPVWAAVGKFTNDPAYLDYLHREYQTAMDYLFDQEENLFYRDGRFLDRRSPQGEKIFWSRGNGWVYAGLPLLLEQLPANDPRRDFYTQLYLRMSASLAKLQGDQGFWPVSLLEGAHYPLPETSGTGFITFGLAWGINRGLLTPGEYQPAVERGWHALVSAVNAEGKLGWVQQVGYGPDQVKADDTQLYGVGAFLLAASEVSALGL